MRFNYLLFTIFLFFITNTYGSKTTIKGYAKSFVGQEISFIVYEDYISNQKQSTGYTIIKNDGSYSFEFDSKKIEKLTLKIEDKTTWLFIEPGKVYNINLSYDPNLNKQRIYDKKLSLFFSFPNPNELNQQVKKFNNSFDKFINDNVILLKKRGEISV